MKALCARLHAIEALVVALRSIVEALGGPKRVASELWPSKSITDAARYLNHCLDASRAEKLSLDEVLWLLKHGAEADVHTGMHFLAQHCGYKTPERVNPETERDKLMREYIESVNRQEVLVRRLEAVNGR